MNGNWLFHSLSRHPYSLKLKGLRWGDVDFENGTITFHVPKTAHHGNGYAEPVIPMFGNCRSREFLQAERNELLEDFDPKTNRLNEQPVSLELSLEIDSAQAFEVGVKVRCSPDGKEQAAIVYDAVAHQLKIDMTQSTLRKDVAYLDSPIAMAIAEKPSATV